MRSANHDLVAAGGGCGCGGYDVLGVERGEEVREYGEKLYLAQWEPLWAEGFRARKDDEEVLAMHENLCNSLYWRLSITLERQLLLLLLEVRD